MAEHGLASVTMSQIAKATSIGRATLYKYFPDVEAILFAWHERLVAGHLAQLAAIRDQVGDPDARLEAVLEVYALHSRPRHGSEQAAFLHRGAHMARAEQQLTNLIRDLLIEGVQSGAVRDDVPPEALASYCLYALEAASRMPTSAAVLRLISLTLAGLRPA